jgi:6-phosphogluconolactonase
MKILKAIPVLSVIVAAEFLLMSVSSGFAGEKQQIALTDASFNGASKYRVYIGTYTNGDSKGIYRCTLNMKDGSLTNLKLAAETVNPSFLAIHPNRRYLYAVNEVSDFQGKQNNGGVSAFAINKQTGKLRLLNQQSTGGASPCHLVVDAAGKNVLVANYHGGSIAAYSIQEDGSLSIATSFIQHTGGSRVNSPRQDEPHPHSINLDAANRFAFVADLGLDKVLVYRFDSRQGTLIPNEPAGVSVPPGAGPRHFAFHPNGKTAYVINEIDSTVTAFQYNQQRGVLKSFQTLSTLPAGFDGRTSTADVQVHPSGNFLYGSNRGHDSIAIYTIDNKSGRLKYVEKQKLLGQTPRNFAMDPAGRYLFAECQKDGFIETFRIDPNSGRLSSLGKAVSVPSPVCVKMMPLEE